MNTNEFRKEVEKIMPGYKWTIQRPYKDGGAFLKATGTQSAGFNRLSTIKIERRVNNDTTVVYEASIADYGMRGPWRATFADGTLARALRGVQEQCEAMRGVYSACVVAMNTGRGKVKGG